MSVANTTIILKKSGSTGNVPSSLNYGETALNYADGKLYYKNYLGSIAYITNQQTFATINANNTLILAGSPTDTLSIIPGQNIYISACTVTKSITISAPVAGGSTPLNDTITSTSTTSAGTANSVNAVYNYAQTLSNKTYTFRQNTVPSTSNTTDLWFNVDTGVVYENFGNTSNPIWAEFGPSGQASNTQPGVVTGTSVYSNGVELLTFSQQSFDKANSASSNTIYLQGGLNTANANISYILGTNVNQNTNIQSAWNVANNALANTGGTINGNLTVSGGSNFNRANIIYQPATTTGSALQITAANTIGGTGYADVLRITNSSGGATNPNKSIRLNTTGGIEIIDSNYGNNILTLTDSGDLTIKGSITSSGVQSGYNVNRPAFRVIGNGGQIFSGNTVTSSNWTMDYNQGGYLNTSTGIFTAPVAGLYQVNVVVRTSSNANPSINQIIIYKNTTSIIMVEFGVNTTMNHAGGSTVIKLAAGDTLKFAVTSGSISFDGNDNWSVAYIG